MDVAVTELRAHLSEWLGRVSSGEEIIVTDRGVPVARIVDVASTTALERLIAEGVIAPARRVRPRASGRARPKARRPIAEIVSELRG